MKSGYLEQAKNIAGESLAAELAVDVVAVEEFMRTQLCSDVVTVEAIGKHTGGAGGKRLRPLLVSLSARASGREFSPERVHAVGACVEMIHMATLIHDDVIDEAPMRRGKPSANAMFGATAAILTGDVLLSKAMRILGDDGDLKLIRSVSQAVVELAEGEVAELEARGNFDLEVGHHLEILRKKTATFMACCCRAGAIIAGASQEIQTALSQFGESVGMAFQIADDVLDFVGDESKTGKPRATDFREGCATLPLILARESLDSEAREFFGNGVTEPALEKMILAMTAKGVFVESLSQAERYSDSAIASLKTLPATDARNLLEEMSRFIVARDA